MRSGRWATWTILRRFIEATPRTCLPDYRADIDGLRALAVGMVLAFHATSDHLRGGYLGVDIFFVISGFLITRIIVARIDRGDAVLGAFYRARVRRLFPALIVVLTATVVAGWFVYTTQVYSELGRQVAASGLFVANLFFWKTTNYFAAGADYALIHLWSLGVEEQFYFAWPCVLLLVARAGRRYLPYAAATTLVASLCLAASAARSDPVESFFLPWDRAWELMSGALLAFMPLSSRPSMTKHIAAVLAILAIAGSAFHPDALALLGLPAMLPVAATSVLIASNGAWISRRILAMPPAVYVGLISYPLYLWHWPILHLLSAYSFGLAPPSMRLGGLFLSLALAALTFHFVERRPWNARAIPLLGAMGMVVVAGGLLARHGFPQRSVNNDPRRAFIATYDDIRRGPGPGSPAWDCNFYDTDRFTAKVRLPARCAIPTDRPSVVLWGDSHGQALYPGLRATLPGNFALIPLSTSDCPPSLAEREPSRNPLAIACQRSLRNIRISFERHAPDVLILAQFQDHERTDWDAIARWARRMGVRHVILVGPTPNWYPTLPAIVARDFWNKPHARLTDGLSGKPAVTDQILTRRYRDSSSLTYVSPIQILCDDRGCLATLDGATSRRLTVSDYGHLTPWASRYVSSRLLAPMIIRGAAIAD